MGIETKDDWDKEKRKTIAIIIGLGIVCAILIPVASNRPIIMLYICLCSAAAILMSILIKITDKAIRGI